MDKKSKNPILLLLLAFVVIVILVFIGNYRSVHVQKLFGPRAGVERLSTCGERLVAISKDKEVYAWLWSDLSGWPQVGSVKAKKVVAVSGDCLIWVPSAENNVVVLSNLKGDKELKRLSLPGRRKCNLLEVSPNGKYAVAALAASGYGDRAIRLAVTDCNLTSIFQVVTKTVEDGFGLNDIGVSNDGSLIAAVGRKDGGWVLVADVQSRKILWERTIGDASELNNVIFSPDGKIVYGSDPGRFVYGFEVATQEVVKKFEIAKYKTPPNNPQTISCIAISADGRLLAAATEPASNVCVWDAETGRKITVISGESLTISGVAFSPDSSLLATGILVSSTLNVWRVEERR